MKSVFLIVIINVLFPTVFYAQEKPNAEHRQVQKSVQEAKQDMREARRAAREAKQEAKDARREAKEAKHDSKEARRDVENRKITDERCVKEEVVN